MRTPQVPAMAGMSPLGMKPAETAARTDAALRSIVGKMTDDAVRLRQLNDELAWLVRRVQGIRSVNRWTKAERDRSWADWEARAMVAVKRLDQEAA